MDRSIVQPINALSDASVQFYADGSAQGRDTHSFSDLNIHTGDEIETLADSMAKMEQEINDHIQALLSTKRELHDTMEYAEEMARNATKDALTGVRNKRAYEAAIGYAIFDPATDTDANSVFERADKAMYNDKLRTKECVKGDGSF